MESSSVSHKRIQKKPLVISPKDEAILRVFVTYRGLTAEQVTRLLYSSGSLTYVRVKLLELVGEKYLTRFQYPTVSSGTTPFVYTLGPSGIRYLTAIGMELAGFKPLKEKGKEPSYYFLKHLLSLNDFLIAATLVPRLTHDVSMQNFLHEWQLKQNPLVLSQGRDTISVVPDAWLDCKVLVGSSKKPYAMPIWVEMDMGTEWGKKFKDKLKDIVRVIIEGVYQDRFGVKNVTVAFPTPGNEKRRDLMRSHINAVLHELGQEAYADLFLFACLPENYDPQTAFLSPIWYSPTGNTPFPLLDLSD